MAFTCRLCSKNRLLPADGNVSWSAPSVPHYLGASLRPHLKIVWINIRRYSRRSATSITSIVDIKYGVRTPKFIWAPCVQLSSLAETPLPLLSLHIWAHIRGNYTVKKGSQVSRPQPGCHYQTLTGRE